ncbi:MAG: hypothetical protein ACI80V_000073 [Rhodothermales bacterium]|jgi:hypothetical protein
MTTWSRVESPDLHRETGLGCFSHAPTFAIDFERRQSAPRIFAFGRCPGDNLRGIPDNRRLFSPNQTLAMNRVSQVNEDHRQAPALRFGDLLVAMFMVVSLALTAFMR